MASPIALDDPLCVTAERAHVSERLLVFEPVGRERGLSARSDVRDVDLAGGFERGDVVRPAGRPGILARGWPSPRLLAPRSSSRLSAHVRVRLPPSDHRQSRGPPGARTCGNAMQVSALRGATDVVVATGREAGGGGLAPARARTRDSRRSRWRRTPMLGLSRRTNQGSRGPGQRSTEARLSRRPRAAAQPGVGELWS